MSAQQFDPQEEHDAVYLAITELHEQWGKPGMVLAVACLAEAVEHGERALATLEPHAAESGLACQIRVAGLRTLVECAQDELQRVERFAYAARERPSAREESPGTALAPVFPAGTIVSCPTCGEGVYKVTIRSTTRDLVLDDGMVLVLLNATIPKRDAWTSLACPGCGGRLFRDGQIHTLQQGWV